MHVHWFISLEQQEHGFLGSPMAVGRTFSREVKRGCFQA